MVCGALLLVCLSWTRRCPCSRYCPIMVVVPSTGTWCHHRGQRVMFDDDRRKILRCRHAQSFCGIEAQRAPTAPMCISDVMGINKSSRGMHGSPATSTCKELHSCMDGSWAGDVAAACMVVVGSRTDRRHAGY